MIKRPLNFPHEILKNTIVEGDHVIDATVGNGHDTNLLAQLVGERGKVYGFDIQQQAIENTREKLLLTGQLSQVELIQDGHENINNYMPEGEQIAAITFNLGYLPKGDKSIITKAHTTVSAIEQSLVLLRKQGIISIMIYFGHEGGLEEKEKVDQFVADLPQVSYQVFMYKIVNQVNNPPYLYIIQKI